MDKYTHFPALVAQIDAAVGRAPSRLGFRYRNDERFERLCNATAMLHNELTRERHRVVLGSAPALRQAIERYESRYHDRIRAASDKALAAWLDGMLDDTRNRVPDDVEPSDDSDTWAEPFDERFHLPATALKDLVNHCLNTVAFNADEDPDANRIAELADGALDYIEQSLGLDLDEAARRRRSLKSYHVGASLQADSPRDWRRVESYLHEAMTAYVLGHHLAAVALARPIAEHVIRTAYVPVLCPDMDSSRAKWLTELVRRVQEAPTGAWIKAENGERIIEAASKVLHYSHFDDFKTDESLAVLANRILDFVRLLLLRAPG